MTFDPGETPQKEKTAMPEMTDEQELWLLRYVVAWMPERLYKRLSAAMPAQFIDFEVYRQLVEEFVDEATEARAGEAFREQVESVKS